MVLNFKQVFEVGQLSSIGSEQWKLKKALFGVPRAASFSLQVRWKLRMNLQSHSQIEINQNACKGAPFSLRRGAGGEVIRCRMSLDAVEGCLGASHCLGRFAPLTAPVLGLGSISPSLYLPNLSARIRVIIRAPLRPPASKLNKFLTCAYLIFF